MSVILNHTLNQLTINGAGDDELLGSVQPFGKIVYSDVVPPTGDNDINDGFFAGSLWVDTSASNVYISTDSSAGAAVWEELALSGGGSGDLVVSGNITANGGTVIGYKDNATSVRSRGPQAPSEGGADVQSYAGIFYSDGYLNTGTLKTRFIMGGNLEMDVALVSPHQLQLVGLDGTQTDGQVYVVSQNDVVFNMRSAVEEESKQLIFDRVDKGTYGTANTSDVEISASAGDIVFASIPVLPTFAVGSLPAGQAGGMIFVTGASMGDTQCFYDGANWIDVRTGTTVTA